MEENPFALKELTDAMTEMPSRIAGQERRRPSIYRLPTFVTNLKSKTFNPQIVSIGPYHHGDENLKAMEEHKFRALFYSLRRPGNSLQSYANALIEVVQELKDAYDHLDLNWQQNTEKFLQLMILDGCFILEIMSAAALDIDDYDINDPIFSQHGKLYLVRFLRRDMLMLENQLPLLVLEKLENIRRPGPSRLETMSRLTTLILNFFHGRSFQNRGPMLLGDGSLHMLDIYRKSLVLGHDHPRYREYARTTRSLGGEIIPSATELFGSGIKFGKSKSRSLMDISFRNGVLYLPLIVFDDTTESLFENVIAFERFHVGAGNEVSSYIFFMDCIIKTPTDVTLLQSHGIVQNAHGSNEAVVNFINSLSGDVTLYSDDDLFDFEVHEKVRAYCMKPRNKWRAKLMLQYFNDPKDTINIQMGIFLFYLTVIQTIFTVLSYTSSSPRTR